LISSQHVSHAARIRRTRPARGFTLVELLVVITIIGILTSLLLPAVQSARESGRETQCKSNLRQLAQASLTSASTYGFYPGGGWGWGWFGEPSDSSAGLVQCGAGVGQPGGWIYNILPYVDQQNLHDLQAGKSGQALAAAAYSMLSTPLAILNCPSRRPLATYPTWITAANMYRDASMGNSNSLAPQTVAKTDYAANAGDNDDPNSQPNWASTGSERSYNGGTGPGSYTLGTGPAALNQFRTCAQLSNGVVYTGSMCSVDSVTDGISNTYLLGEKYLPPDDYTNGQDGGDNENAYMGWNEDIGRFAGRTDGYPKQDTPGLVDAGNNNFGSCHPDGFGMAMCDGSVRTIPYAIDLTVHANLANRHDGNVIDQSKY
jgi:prepilin-type N-terminal cleavage/methylation domain-containing protein